MGSRSGMVSRLAVAISQIAVAATITACGGGTDDNQKDPTVITAQPTEQSATVNGTARFVLQATGDGLKYQWQRSTNSGSTWSDVVGATQSVLEIFNVTLDQDGHLYRARVSGDDGTVTTTAVALHCNPVVVSPSFTVNLSSPAQITEGAGVTLAVTAAGTSLTYRWQTSPAGGSTWSTLSGNNSPQLLLNNVPLSDNGRRYKVTISNSAGSATSQTATLSVKAATSTPEVTTQPLAVSVKAPAAATFTVAVSGNPTPTVQWQSSATNSSNNSDWTDISSANDLTYRIDTSSTGLSGRYYRAKVSNSIDTTYSNAARLTVTDADVAPSITTQPTSQTVTGGAQATFTVAATGTPTPTIQWQVSSNGGSTWTNITSANSTTYSFTASTVGTALYRAVASNGVGSAANSNAATLTITAGSGNPDGSSNASSCVDLDSLERNGAGIDVSYRIIEGKQSGTITAQYRVGSARIFNGNTVFPLVSAETKTLGSSSLSGTVTTFNKIISGIWIKYGNQEFFESIYGSITQRIETEDRYTPPISHGELKLNTGANYQVTATGTQITKTSIFINGILTSTPINATNSMSISNSVKFVGKESLSIPAGTFSTCRFEVTSGGKVYQRYWLIPHLGTILKQEDYDPSSGVVGNSKIATLVSMP